MKKIILHSVRTALAAIIFSSPLYAQQDMTFDKNNTRPEITRQLNMPAKINAFVATQHNGYNEIQWTARTEQETRRYVVEYSDDGIHFQSAGEATTTTTGYYLLKHQTFQITPILYRVKIEDFNGRYTYSQNILLSGVEVNPVKIYPTIINGNTVNIIADLPVERITVFSGNGTQVYSQDVNGKMESLTVVLPSLGKGMYWMHFIGQGWKTTEKFIIP